MVSGMSWLVGLRFCLRLAAVPKHHVLLHGIQDHLTAVGIGLGPFVEPCHRFHVQGGGLQFCQGQLQGRSGFVVTKFCR